jgi:hypothetical protein
MPNGTPNGNGRDKPLIGSTKGAKLTVGGILTALVGSGGYFVQQASEEISFLHTNAVRHEAQTARMQADVERLEDELKRLEQVLFDKLQISVPPNP